VCWRFNTVDELTTTRLRELYVDQLLTDSEIAKRYGTYQVKISRLRKKWGIETLDKTGRLAAQLPDVTPLQHELLIGSLLGDGSMSATSSRAARFTETHSMSQEEYLRWKVRLLEPYSSAVYDTTKVEGATVYHGKGFTTRSCVQLYPFYELFYGKGHRVFPTTLSKLMTPFALAVWYMDDGNASGGHPRIAFGLDDKSLSRAVRGLRKLGLRPEVSGEGSDIGIHFPGQTEAFFELVRPHMPECMGYKLPDPTDRQRKDRHAKLLTPDLAKSMREGGLSNTEIAKVFNVSTSTVRRRMETAGAPKRMGRPRRKYTQQAAEVALGNYSPEEWSGLDDTAKARWVDQVFAILRASPFPAPEPSDRSEVQDTLASLRSMEPRLDENDDIRPRSYIGTRVCKSFFPNRYRASWRGTQTAHQAWYEDARLRWAIRFQLDHGDPVLPHRVLRAVTMRQRTPTVFRPAVAKYIYDTYCPAGGTVWDPCAGYGGRLLGAAASGVRYIGTDVEKATVAGNLSLRDLLGSDADVYLCPAEEFLAPPVDLVFTSPPYFDVERYSGQASQSYKRFSTFEKWLDGFLRPVIRTAYRAGATRLTLNVTDIKERKKVLPLVDETKRIAEDEGFEFDRQLWMPISNLNRSGRAGEPVLVFGRSTASSTPG